MEESYRNPKTVSRRQKHEKEEIIHIEYSQLVKTVNKVIAPSLIVGVMLLAGIFIHLVFG